MSSITEIESKLLGLSPVERERLAVKAWESLANDAVAVSDAAIDPDGIGLSAERDAELECGSVVPISEEEFRRRTDGDE